MLRSLYVRDYALIEELDVEFDAGLNIITGETGAGKSILIGALQMILGTRASTDTIRSGAKKAIIEGVFEGVRSEVIRSILADNSIDEQPAIILRREITSTQSRGFINDTPATIQVMRDVASNLIDLHGQHEHQSLLDVSRHLELLDSFGDLDALRGAYESEYRTVTELVRERSALQSSQQEMEQKKELYEFQIREIDRISPVAGEEEELDAERRLLENAERLYASTSDLYSRMYEGDHAVHDELVTIRDELEDLAQIDSQFEEMLKEIASATIIVSEAASFLQHYNAGIEFNPERLEEIRVRSSDLERLKRKYGGSVDAVLEYRREIGDAFEVARDFEGALVRLDERIRSVQAALTERAVELSTKRRQAAERVRGAVEDECRKLGMPDTRFEVQLTVEEDEGGWIHSDTVTPTCKAFESGMDQAEFYISSNLGEEPRALARIASGGEISRIMLALKTILARSEALPILVFDEIDVGISGAIAGKVGESMHQLSESHQIIAITHLPQIAARGDVHFLVEKYVEDGRTKTRIRRLSDDHRARHVASLMSGAEISAAAMESARELLDVARRETPIRTEDG